MVSILSVSCCGMAEGCAAAVLLGVCSPARVLLIPCSTRQYCCRVMLLFSAGCVVRGGACPSILVRVVGYPLITPPSSWWWVGLSWMGGWHCVVGWHDVEGRVP